MPSEGESVDFGGVQAADGGNLLGRAAIEADHVAGREDRARGEAAEVTEIQWRDGEPVGKAQEVAGQRFARRRVDAPGQCSGHAVAGVGP
ncbi:hypothetical protein OG552_30220 [Streptomyces sp. NBC_01476]|uniref:hypothetical protein n=1 Tax=Streptomyces sp. NBC_01476 TaxID=2903881 RepID=UPI002E34AF28|nr:hypothetical protein [Streptomyces sp. NBC_01476]